jgi:hypothetical protein
MAENNLAICHINIENNNNGINNGVMAWRKWRKWRNMASA